MSHFIKIHAFFKGYYEGPLTRIHTLLTDMVKQVHTTLTQENNNETVSSTKKMEAVCFSETFLRNVSHVPTNRQSVKTQKENIDNRIIFPCGIRIVLWKCSGLRQLSNLARRFAAKAMRLALPSTFYYGLWNVLRVCLLDLAAGVHEILHLRTTW
jgi:hypothetical protein